MQPFSDKIRLMSLVLALLLVTGCEPDEKREYWGNLYFGIGAYLGQLDLRDGSVSLLANLGNTSIREIDAFGDEQLLLSVIGPVNQEDTFRLMQYELAGGGLATLINGRHGRYLPESKALVFDNGAHLKVRQYGKDGMEQLDVARHRFGAGVQVLQVAPTQFIYSIFPDQAIHLFDLQTQQSMPLSSLSVLCAIDTALWIADRDALLCKRVGEGVEYAFVSLTGKNQGALAIPDAGPFLAVAHLDDQDAIVLTEHWNTVVSGQSRYAIWIYDLANDHMVRLVKDQPLGRYVIYSGE